jgi:integrase
MITGSKVIEYTKAVETAQTLLQSDKDKNLGLLILCGVNFGLRIGDLLSIDFNQLKSGKFMLHEQKTNKRRMIVVNATVQAALVLFEDSLAYKNGGKVFRSKKGTVYSPQQINRKIKDIFGEGYSSHGLRKGFGKRVYERKGKDLSVVQIQLQHSNPAHTLRYIGVTQQEIEDTFSDIM